MPFEFSVSDLIPASAQDIYDAWLSSSGHEKITGQKAQISAQEGAAFTVWNGYISGRNLKLEPGRRVAAQLLRADEATLQARAVRACGCVVARTGVERRALFVRRAPMMPQP